MSLNTPLASLTQEVSWTLAGAMRVSADRVSGWPRRRAEPDLRYPGPLILAVLDEVAAINDPIARHGALPAARRRVFELLHGRAEGPSAIFRPRWTTESDEETTQS